MAGVPWVCMRPHPRVGVALGGRGLSAHSGLRVKGQRGWVNLRTFPPPRDQISHSLRILWGLEVFLKGQRWGSSHVIEQM